MSREVAADFHYVHLYADADGESHFEDIALSGMRQGHAMVSAAIPLSSMIMRRVVSGGGDAVAHNAPRRQFIVHLEGSVEVEASDGERRRFGPGDVVLVEDVDGDGHRTRRLGEGPHRTLFLPIP
jgi:quercetin dioxygenase-like cupin family protein